MEKSSTDRAGAEPCRVEVVRDRYISEQRIVAIVIFFVDATIPAWRRGDRQRALIVGGALIFFSAIAIGQVVLVVWGVIDPPFLACFSYLGLIAAMGYEMSSNMLQRGQLTRQLQASEVDLRETQQRMELAATAAELGMWMWDIVSNEIWITDKGRALFGFGPSEKLDFDRYRMDNCAGSPGVATSSVMATVSRFECAV